MFKHYILSSLRSIGRHRMFSLINILGLALGLASFLIIFLYVQDELKYDAFHKDSDRIYRIIQKNKKSGGGSANLPGVFEDHLKGRLPQVKALASFFRDPKAVIGHGERQFPEKAVHFTTPEMFDILTLSLKSGDPEKALDSPNKMVITREMARKYFGDEDPLGKTLTVDQNQTYKITGILKSLPEQSHLDIDFLASLPSVKQYNKLALSHWGFASSYFYLKLTEDADPDKTGKTINNLFQEQKEEKYRNIVELKLQPLKEIYLRSSGLEYDMAKHSNIKYVVGFSALAVFILLIAGFNYMNLSTARVSIREKEIAMRKIVGAPRKKIITQFLGESLMFTIIAGSLAILIVYLALPWFNEISGKTMGIAIWEEPGTILAYTGIIIFMTLFAGSYPALLLSGTKPLAIMSGAGASPVRGEGNRMNWHLKFRQVLVFLQFAISIFLIIAALVVYKQIHYIQNKNLGVETEQVAIVKNPYDRQMGSRYKTFSHIIKDYPEVRHVSSTFSAPPHLINNFTRLQLDGQKDQAEQFGLISVNFDYFETIGARIVKGRDFSEDFRTDAGEAVILNEAGARQFEQEGLLNKELTGFYDGKTKKIIGVVGDIHFLSVHKKMPPLAFFVSREKYPPCYPEIVVKLQTSDMASAVNKMENAWKEAVPGWPFQVSFMDQKYDALYRSEYKVRQVLTLFTTLAIFLSLLGLLGLAIFSADRRMREIGIRKAMGANMKDIGALLSGEFSRWILVSNLIAWPAAWYVMKGWLNNYVYKTELSAWIFIAATTSAVAVTGIILLYQTLRAGKANPAAILREE